MDTPRGSDSFDPDEVSYHDDTMSTTCKPNLLALEGILKHTNTREDEEMVLNDFDRPHSSMGLSSNGPQPEEDHDIAHPNFDQFHGDDEMIEDIDADLDSENQYNDQRSSEYNFEWSDEESFNQAGKSISTFLIRQVHLRTLN